MKKLRFVWSTFFAGLLLIPLSLSPAQEKGSIKANLNESHQWRGRALHQGGQVRSGVPFRELIVTPQAVDVQHYKLQIHLTPDPPQITGSVTIEGETSGQVNVIRVDAQDNLIIDSVQFDGRVQSFQRTTDQVVLNFSEPLATNQSFTIVVTYHGVPVTSGVLGGGMLVSRHSSFWVMATLSEPYAAPTWWPCIDNPADKATAEVEATVPNGYVATSNGQPQRPPQPNADQTVTYFWRENYPIANYLIAVTTTNFAQFQDTYTALDGATTMPLVYYVYPEHLTLAQQKFAVTRRAIEIYASLFGEYPFLAEKYGMVEFPWCGGMEHQTLTSLGSCIVGSQNLYRSTIVHELSHQWWGDWVTMKTWHDIWLNEGFATYSEVLFSEHFLNLDPGELMDGYPYDPDHQVCGRLGGTVYAEDLADPWDDSWAIYKKGGWVLHMLRHILGDDQFFATLRDYGQRFAYSNASTEDFQHVCEDHYGAPLDWFFQQWIYAPGRPIYHATSSFNPGQQPGEYTAVLTLEQQQSQQIPGCPGPLPPVYIMPIDVTIHYADGSQETRVVWNNTRRQQFSFDVSKQPVQVELDEEHWILKELRMN